jgi:hypothetical protein
MVHRKTPIIAPYGLKDYVHEKLYQEVTAIAGYYVLTEEGRLPLHEREVLFLLGYGVIDNSCCGSGSCSYAVVPGFIIHWKYTKTAEGLPVTRVEPIRYHTLQNEIRASIQQRAVVCQVNFLLGQAIPRPSSTPQIRLTTPEHPH